MTTLTKEHFDMTMLNLMEEITLIKSMIISSSTATKYEEPNPLHSESIEYISTTHQNRKSSISLDNIISYNRIDFTSDMRSSRNIESLNIDIDVNLDEKPMQTNTAIDYVECFNNSKIDIFSDTSIRYLNYISVKLNNRLFIGFGTINNEINNRLFSVDEDGIVNEIFYSRHIPKARTGCAYALCKNYLYIYGGFYKENNNNINIYDDMIRINLKTSSDHYAECDIISDNLYIGNRYLTRMVSMNNRLYLFGGFEYYNQIYPNDLVELSNLNECMNSRLVDERLLTDIPGRANHIMSTINSSEILICCGNDHYNLLNDFHLYDLVKRKTFTIDVNGVKPDKGLSCSNYENHLIIYGGKYGLMFILSLNTDHNYKVNYDKNYVHKNGAILVEKGVLYDLKNTSTSYTRKFSIKI